ncbi:hypothetical protein D3C76_794880 [compost metagenome]
MEGDDGARRAGVAIAVEDHWRLLLAGVVAQQLAADELVHGEVGLMEPEAVQLLRLPALLPQLFLYLCAHQRQHLLEHLAPLLAEQLVIPIAGARAEAVQEAEVVADVVGVLGHQLARHQLPGVGHLAIGLPLQQHGGAGVAKDEVAVSIPEIEVPRADLGVHHQGQSGGAGRQQIRRRLDAEGGGGTGHVHVKGHAARPQIVLQLDGQRRVGARHVGGRDDDQIYLPRLATGGDQRLLGGSHRHLHHDGGLVIGALRQQGLHDVRIQHPLPAHQIAALDTGRLLDELAARMLLGGQLARIDGGGILLVVEIHILVEGRHQLFIADGKGRGIEA